MSELIPFVTMKNCLEAIEFYKKVFNAKLSDQLTMMNDIKGFEDDKYKNKVGHATLEIGKSEFFLCDSMSDHNHIIGNNVQFVLNLEDEKTLRSKFATISQDGEVIEELHEVFFGALFGIVKDKFGIYWQLYYGHK